MFVEEVILCALAKCPFWNVSEYLLEHERCGPADKLARAIADRNYLRVQPITWQDRKLYRFTRIE